MKSKTRINWMSITNETRRKQLQLLARRMKRAGYTEIQLDYGGANQWWITGFNTKGGVWIG